MARGVWDRSGKPPTRSSTAKNLFVAILISVFTTRCTAQPETVAELRAKADQGYAEAQFSLGVRYAKGEGVPQTIGGGVGADAGEP